MCDDNSCECDDDNLCECDDDNSETDLFKWRECKSWSDVTVRARVAIVFAVKTFRHSLYSCAQNHDNNFTNNIKQPCADSNKMVNN